MQRKERGHLGVCTILLCCKNVVQRKAKETRVERPLGLVACRLPGVRRRCKLHIIVALCRAASFLVSRDARKSRGRSQGPLRMRCHMRCAARRRTR